MLDLLLPGLLPARDSSFRFPRLERWLARADLAREPAAGAEAWLASRFGLEAAAEAPVTLAADAGPADGTWLRADPVHARATGDTMVLHDASGLEIAPGEARALVDALQSHFAGDGLEFRAPRPDRWYVRVPEAEVPETTPLARAIGRDTFGLLPRGRGRFNWLSAMTEAQMILAAHPVNASREAAGRLPINGVWFWGGGPSPSAPRSPYSGIHASDPFARGLALLAGVAPGTVPASLATIEPSEGATLVVLDDFEDEWLAPIAGALARFEAVRLVLPAAGHTVVGTLTRAARWRILRRPRPLADHA